MNTWRRAHSPKLEVPTDREQVERHLLNEYHWRRALWRMGSFRGVDPLTPGQRERAACYLERERKDASIYLACRAARAKHPSTTPARPLTYEIGKGVANIPPGVYRHIGDGIYQLQPKHDRREVRRTLRVIPGGRS